MGDTTKQNLLPLPGGEEFGLKDVNVVEKTTPFQGYFRIDKYKVRHRLFKGGWSGVMEREIFDAAMPWRSSPTIPGPTVS